MLARVSRAVVIAGGVALLGGCAPVTFAPAGFNIGGILNSPSSFSQCAGLANASPEAARMGIRSAAIQAFAIQNRIQRIQSQFQLGFDVRQQQAGWRQIASGEC